MAPPNNILPPYSAIFTIPLASIASEGMPDTSLTVKMSPSVKLFEIEKSCPSDAEKFNVPVF